MKSQIVVRWFAVLLLFMALSTTKNLNAQETSEDLDLYSYATKTKVTVEFEGGTVEMFVEQIREQAPQLNILIRSDAQNVVLPRLRLRNIEADAALRSMNHVLLDTLNVDIDESQAYYVVGSNLDRMPDLVEVVSVSSLLWQSVGGGPGDFEIPDGAKNLMDAIEAGQQMLETTSGSMKISLHEKTGLLFVKGNPEETRLVKQIVQELVGSARERMNAMMSGPNSMPNAGGKATDASGK